MPTNHQTVRILIAEDNDEMRASLGSQLRALPNVEVSEARSGAEAIGSVYLAREPIHLIISDLDMPQGTGLSVLSFLMKRQHQIPFVFFTTFGLDLPEIEYKKFLGVITKDNPRQLFELVTKTIQAIRSDGGVAENG